MSSLAHFVTAVWQQYREWVEFICICTIAWRWPRLGNRLFSAIERMFAKIASRKAIVVAGVALFTVGFRICLLPWFPIRHPGIPDEFSYLLAGDTFVHGRLTNPPHPMATYLDTLQVLQHPTYQSMYPPAQGGIIATGLLLGHPWIGVVLSVGLMFALLNWALQAWLPGRWALLGTLLLLARFGIFGYWMNSYYGGAAAAIGGCLLLGSMPRIIRHRRVHHAVLFGLGAGLLANSRPYEGMLAFIPAACFLLYWLIRSRERWKSTVPTVVVPVVLTLTLCAGFTLYYNFRVTGDAWLFPHLLDDQMHLPGSNFVWGSQRPPIHFVSHEFDVEFNHFSRNYFRHTWDDFLRITQQKAAWFEDFYLGPALLLPFAALPWVLLDRKMRFLLIQLLTYGIGAVLVIWYTPHYSAPVMAALAVILVQLFRHLRQWNYRGRPVGVGLTRAVAVMCVIGFASSWAVAVSMPFAGLPGGWGWYSLSDRAADEEQLESTPGRHLVVVRYSQVTHNPSHEWVDNGADIDGAKVVWAREIPAISMRPLLDYYRDRTIWLVEPDKAPRDLIPYRPTNRSLRAEVSTPFFDNASQSSQRASAEREH